MDELNKTLADIDVVILCGGFGKRLQSTLPNRPKVLAPIKERVFIDILIESFVKQGFKRFILSVGYLKQQIINHRFENIKEIELTFSEEETPLGTGGAIKKCQTLIQSDPFLVTNGDSLCKLDFKNFLEFHFLKGGVTSFALSTVGDRKDGGNVEILPSQRIVNFKEKNTQNLKKNYFINAGVYIMNREVFSLMPTFDTFSLECDLFPKLLGNDCYGFFTESDVIDIGTFDRYVKAIGYLENL